MADDREEDLRLKLREVEDRVRVEQLIPTLRLKTHTDEQFLLRCLKNHFIFYNLSEKQIRNVRDSMWMTEVPQSADVFRQGERGTCFFIIANGVVSVAVNNQVVRQLRTGDGFGELALIYETPRPSTVTAREDLCLWAIDSTGFKEAVEEVVVRQFEENQRFLEGVPFYQFLNNSQKDKIASSLVTLRYYKGQNIAEEGDPGSAFYFITEGTASLLRGSVEERKISRGQNFGLNSLYYNTIIRMSVRAEDSVTCQVLGRETLAKIIGPDNYSQTMFRNYAKDVLQKNKELFSLMRKNQDAFFQSLRVKYFKSNDKIIKNGFTVNKLLIVVEGRIKKFRGSSSLASTGQIWGENFVHSPQVRLQDDIVAESEAVLIQLSTDYFRAHLNLHQAQEQHPQSKTISSPESLSEMVFMGIISKQPLCEVALVRRGKQLLAAKIYRGGDTIGQKANILLQQQLFVLGRIKSPLCVQVRQCHVNEKQTVILTDYIRGTSLYEVIREIGLLSSADCQFYIASLLLLLDYLAQQSVVIRDLKPENILINEKGHLHLASFGCAKHLGGTHKTSTVVGTPHYMAPEVVLGKQYNEMVDLWAIGIMLYEFLIGQVPFGADKENPYEIFESIIKAEMSFPKNFRDRRAKRVIQHLLSLNPENRHNGSSISLRESSWFDSVDWEGIHDRTVTPPYQPNLFAPKPQGPEMPFLAYLAKSGSSK